MADRSGSYLPVTSQPVYSYNQPVASSGSLNVGVMVASPQVMVISTNNKTLRQWSSGICDCGNDCAICCCVLWCLPCYHCHLATKMNENCCVPLCTPGALVAMRVKMRHENNIQGNICDDTSVVCCCYQCVLCQLGREVDHVVRVRSAGDNCNLVALTPAEGL